ncbi:MAG: diguanylate cyclase [Armatimonadetes bacterium]|nr:diguanylate cyclase [Armatimonadota bacterium]
METKRRVLVADDSAITITIAIARGILRSAGYEVLTAADGLAAMNLALRQVPDLIIADVEMPEMTGLQLIRLLKGDPRTQSIPVLILSGHTEQYEQFWGRETGADDYVLKPFSPETLLGRVAMLLERHAAGPRSRPSPDMADTSPAEALERINASLERRLFALTVIQDITELAATTHGERNMVAALLERLSRLLDFTAAVVSLAQGGHTYLLVRRAIHPAAVESLQASVGSALPAPDGPRPAPALLGGMDLIAASAASGAPALLLLPLRVSGQVLGGLGIAREAERPFREPEREILDLVAGQAGLVLDHARLEEVERAHADALRRQADELRLMNEQLAAVSVTDGLTGLYNRRYLDQRLTEEVARARRYGLRLACLMVDIDHFKQMNDRFGHQQGDQVLRATADVLRTTARTSDVVGRYGGEEFCVLAPGADTTAGVILAERIRAGVSERAFSFGDQTVRVTVSVGVAECRGDSTPEGLIAEADRALFAAKTAGRDRVCSAPDAAATPRQHAGGASG